MAFPFFNHLGSFLHDLIEISPQRLSEVFSLGNQLLAELFLHYDLPPKAKTQGEFWQ
jgi:hypothetical protein